MLMERDILLWAGFSQVPCLLWKRADGYFQGLRPPALSFILMAVRIGQAVGALCPASGKEGKTGREERMEKKWGSRMGGDVRNKRRKNRRGRNSRRQKRDGGVCRKRHRRYRQPATGGAAVPSGLMEELKETLAEYITRTLGIHPGKRILLSGKSERGLMDLWKGEYGVYDGFIIRWTEPGSGGENGPAFRPEKEFPEAVPPPRRYGIRCRKEEYRDFTDIIIEYVRTHYAEGGAESEMDCRTAGVSEYEDYVSKRFAQRTGCKFYSLSELYPGKRQSSCWNQPRQAAKARRPRWVTE